VELTNYGAYGGSNSFDFTTTSERPIILIGGMNGAGKTTLFESVMLCFYGIASLEGRASRKSYEAYLAKKVHRKGGMANRDGASVSVTFQISHAGEVHEYVALRSWGTGGEFESFSVQSVGEEKLHKADMDASSWQAFIDGLIPKGIARLFFFDGERIVRMIEEGESSVIKSSFDTLLGLDVVLQLRRDLEVNMMRNMKGNTSHTRDEFERLTADKQDTDDRVTRLMERRASKQAMLDSTLAKAEEMEASISSLGGGFAARRAEIRARREAASTSYDAVSSRIREMCAGSLPFALIPKETMEVKEQIHADRQTVMRSMTADAVHKAAERARARLFADNIWNSLENGSKLRSELIPKLIAALEPPHTDAEASCMFSLSREQEDHILLTIKNSTGYATRELKEASEKLAALEEEISKMDLSLASAPDDDEIGPLISRLGTTQSAIGMLEAEITHIDEEVSSLTALSNHTQVKIRDVLSRLYKDKKAGVRVELTKNVQLALNDYAKKLADKKLAILESNLLDAVTTLMHKKGLVDRVKIDRKTYAITLYKDNDILVPKESLSKGEQQMLITAVLWALARTSGRPLPFMIDTPLARLDAEHRSNLIKRFFPLASHQVIIFSTDSEIGYDEFVQLKEHLSRSYAIEHNAKDDSTLTRAGYFKEELQIAV